MMTELSMMIGKTICTLNRTAPRRDTSGVTL